MDSSEVDDSMVVYYSIELNSLEQVHYFYNTRSDLDVIFYRLIGRTLGYSGSESYLAVL